MYHQPTGMSCRSFEKFTASLPVPSWIARNKRRFLLKCYKLGIYKAEKHWKTILVGFKFHDSFYSSHQVGSGNPKTSSNWPMAMNHREPPIAQLSPHNRIASIPAALRKNSSCTFSCCCVKLSPPGVLWTTWSKTNVASCFEVKTLEILC